MIIYVRKKSPRENIIPEQNEKQNKQNKTNKPILINDNSCTSEIVHTFCW